MDPFDQTPYKQCSQSTLSQMINYRLSKPDCNGGAIFYNTENANFAGNTKGTIRALSSAVPDQNLQLLAVKLPRDQQDNQLLCYNIQKGRRGEGKIYLHQQEQDEYQNFEGIKEEQGKGSKASSPEKTIVVSQNKKEENKQHGLQQQQQEQDQLQDPQKIEFMTIEQVQEYDEKLKEIVTLMASLSMNKIQQQSISQAVEVANGADQEEKKQQEQAKQPEDKMGTRYITELWMRLDQDAQNEAAYDLVEEPIWPDPDKEPLPPPQIHQIVKKPNMRSERHKVQLFQICTVIQGQMKEGDENEDQLQVKETYDQARWTIGPKSQQSLKIKFLSKKIGHYDQTLPFEIYGSPKQFNLQLGGDCEFPTINTNYKNVFMKHKKLRPPAPPESYLNRCYVISQGKFDFGPLLVGKDAEKRGQMAQLKRSNASSFRITNNGKYQLHAQFALRQPPKPEGQVPAEPKGKGAVAAPEKAVFFIQPEQLTLNVDQTENVTVWCFPDRPQQLNGELVTMIKDNPNPAIFKLSTLGALPIIELDTDKVDFDRLLLNQSREKTVTIKNVSAIPINWKLDNLETMPQEFTIDQKAGTLQPTEETVFSIVFKTVEPKMLEHKIKVSVEDTEGFGVKQEPVQQFTLVAEAFDITIALDFPKQQGKEENVLDFEDVRVGEAKQREFKLKNNGKYNVKYNFALKYKSTRQMFTVTPSQGQLQPNQEIEVKVKFLSMKKQVKMKTSKTQASIRLQILQGASQEKFNQLPIYVNVNAVFSKYSVTPLKNINFGPMMYGESRVRSLQIKNNGLFEFAYEICDFADEEAKLKIKAIRDQEKDTMSKLPQEREGADPALVKGGGKKQEKKAPPKKQAKGKGAAAGPPPDALVLQQFLVNPYTGTIAPGSSAVVQVTFNALGAKFYNKTLAIDVANRDPTDQPQGITFQLAAESCVPGINTEDMDSIFEEQTVIPAMDPSDTALQQVLSKSFFVVEDNVFFFGTIVASKMPEGVVQKFKISNPFKIPCAVNFACKPKQQSKHEGFAFEVSPESLRIPPHEHAYVKVAFKPVNMMPYSGILEATVENGTNPQTAKLEFDLRGQGTLPTLSIEQPKLVKPDDGTPLLRFRKTRVGQKFIQTISLKNQGPVQATCRFDVLKHDDFRFLGQISYTIPPKSYQTFDIAFEPKKVGQMNYLLNFETVHNPYEHHKVLLQGEAYEESLMFEGLPDNAEDQLQFGDCIVNKRKKMKFNMTNNTADWMRIQWRESDKTTDFKFSPSIAHIAPRASKPVQVRFVSEQTISHENIPYQCVTSNIRPAQPGIEDQDIVFLSDWGNDKTQVRMVRPSQYAAIIKRKQFNEARKREEIELAALLAKDKKAGAAMKKKLQEQAKARGQLPPIENQIDMNEDETEELVQSIPEPHHEVQAGTEKSVAIKVSATSDFTSFQCETKQILFKPTLMFQNRAHKFSLKNTSKIALNYHWKIVNPETEKIDNGPYTILPRMGQIPPGCDENFVMTFSPHQIQEHFSRVLVGNIKNLRPGSDPLVIDMAGVAQRPICHFELPPSIYREKKARDMTPIDSKYNIIEFQSLGTKVKNTKRFMVINPTNFAYEFEWTSSQQKSSQSSGSIPSFRPLTKKGTILSGKKFEMVFQYTPDKVGTHQSFWFFKIPKCNIVQHFMVVGMVHQPTVLFQTGKVNFGPLLIDGKNRETVYLVNQEHIPFTFNFDRESVKGSPDYADSLSVSPMSGVVSPQSKIAVEIIFKPRLELTYNYNLVCNVKRKMRPLVLNVKGVGYTIKHQVFAGETASTPVSKHLKEPTPVEFGDFFVNEKRTRKIAIENQGAFNFDFVWKRAVNASNNKYITISPESGTVKQGERGQFQITYFPLSDHKLTQFKASLQIVSGPKYDFQLIGSARKPGIKLSFNSYDFGPSFVMRQPMKKIAILQMRNHDQEAISIQSLFDKTPFLDVQLPPGQVLLPTHNIEVPIIFTPREIKKYEEIVKFDFNGIHKMELKVAGEGIPMVIELVDPDNHLVDFGIVPVKGDVTKAVQIVNKSRRPVTFTLMPSDEEAWGRNCLQLSPEKEQFLKPREKLSIQVRFRPKERLQPFQNSIMLQIKDNEARKVFTINGVSHGIELKLMEEVLGFGQVVAGSFLTKKVQLANFGDVGAKFIWDSKAYNKYFHISPQKAYIPPHQDIYLQVTFKPQKPDKDIRCSDIQCKVQGSPQPLKLTLLGSCIAASDASMKQLEFDTIVRQQLLKNVTIDNPTEKKWAINPTISMTHDIGGEKVQYFTGPQILEVPPKGKADYQVSYTPLTMTKDLAAGGAADEEQEVKSQNSVKQALNSKPETHEGALFFPLPDGTALHYKLIGKSLPPKVQDTIQQEVTAKQVNYININVKNWLHKETQRFNVRQEVKDALDPTTRILGASTIDIGGNQSKIYKLSFITYKAGVSRFTVIFQNRKSGQYCSYDVEVKAVQSDQAKDVELACPIRQTASQMIQLDNPMDKGVEIKRAMFTISDQLVDIQPEQFIIPPKSESSFQLVYRPLVQGEKQADVLLKSTELGEFKYNLRLVGLASTQQRSLNFKASLGSDAVSTFKFKHYLKKAIGYTVKLQTLDGNPLQNFKAQPAVVQTPACEAKTGVDAQVNIRYEPNSLGQTRGILKLNSPDGGDYTCLLQGLCVAPSPQGPIKIPIGKPVNVGFRNPLSEKCEFSIHFDNESFSNAGKPGGPLDPGKEMQVQVKYEAKNSQPTGRMIISAKGLPQWVYYLHGEA